MADRNWQVSIIKRLGRTAAVPSTVFIKAPSALKAKEIVARKPSTISVERVTKAPRS
jgi:hypothetical protein